MTAAAFGLCDDSAVAGMESKIMKARTGNANSAALVHVAQRLGEVVAEEVWVWAVLAGKFTVGKVMAGNGPKFRKLRALLRSRQRCMTARYPACK